MKLYTAAIAASILLAGCGGKKGDTGENPKEEQIGEMRCATCGMKITDEKYVARIRTSSGDTLWFDGPIDAWTYYTAIGEYSKGSLTEDKVQAFEVKDYYTGEWLSAAASHYAYSTEAGGPMGAELLPMSHDSVAAFLSSHEGTHIHGPEVEAKIDRLKTRKPLDGQPPASGGDGDGEHSGMEHPSGN